ncbi:MAG TPA: peptidase M23, partial [Myxococcaceae bacterium]|nr:peptidase M23 [Myxococcaceae bacterium]
MRAAAALLVGLLAAPAVRAAETASESDPLEAQRSLVRNLRAQSGNAEAAFGVYAGLARVSAARAAAISAQMRVLGQRLAAAEAEEALARAVLESRAERLRPRLLSLYRVTQRSPLEVLLPAEDVAAFAWRARALSSLVRS